MPSAFTTSNNVCQSSLLKRVAIRKDKSPFYLYQIAHSKLVEVLPYQPYYKDDNWSEWVDKWRSSVNQKVLVRAKTLPQLVAKEGDSVNIIKFSIAPARLKFNVKAKQPVPVLVKMSYFPRWQAYQGRQRLKIYQVAPALMMVYGHGEIEFRYENNLWDYSGYILSLMGICLLIIEVRKRLKKA